LIYFFICGKIDEEGVIIIINLKLIRENGDVRFKAYGNDIDEVFHGEYEEGDKFRVELCDGEFVKIRLDDTLAESIVYVPDGVFEYIVPHGKERKAGYAPEAFGGDCHRIRVSEPTEAEIYGERLISLNSHDRHNVPKYFPHAVANFVTREDPSFFERNAIDGVIDNSSHGVYPYHSWGGGLREDLEFEVKFGTEVLVSGVTLFLRADFPHDTYWKELDVEFSDGTKTRAHLIGTAEGQKVEFEPKVTESVKLAGFLQQRVEGDKLSFAALTQIEIYGNYIKKENEGMEVRDAANAKDVKYYTTDRLREEFHIANLFTKDNIRMVYSHIDRIIVIGMMPVKAVLRLQAGKELAADYFLQRRELGCINIGGKGIITIDGVEYEMNPRDGIYVGMGNKELSFKSVDENNPAKFYMTSCPAHTSYPIVKIDITKARKVPCGSVEDCNKRVINQYIHPEVMKSCQLAMGLTELEVGSNWNTMPSHTHDRRMEVYLYLDMGRNDAVFHMMGEPKETRHIIMHNEEAVISPSWSIHSGVGTKNYSFIWAMCGENQEFTDMDHIETKELR
jgi:4-deoxy-L-threo-5-hexosulose-uronate ketol-isomerase